MERRLVTISFTAETSPGGVPRWVRDFKRFFPESVHYSYEWLATQTPMLNCYRHEWEKARDLAAWLVSHRHVGIDDIIIVDGFWGMGWEGFPNVISVAHGIWSHLIKEEADAGIPPDMPLHHAVQVDYRRAHLDRGGRIVAVSEFIARQMTLQWGFPSRVINNGIDLEKFRPFPHARELFRDSFDGSLIIHGVNDRSNKNKGADHIDMLAKHVAPDWSNSIQGVLLSLDDAYARLAHVDTFSKYDVLSAADLVVIPSGFEGNSYFLLECLACDVPVVAYDVGLPYELKHVLGVGSLVGRILDRCDREPAYTVNEVHSFINDRERKEVTPRNIATKFSLRRFGDEWTQYLEREFGYASPSR